MIFEHDKRSGLDRRSGNDRRKDPNRAFFDVPHSQRPGAERREENHEIRAGWVKVSKHSSVFLGVPIKKLK